MSTLNKSGIDVIRFWGHIKNLAADTNWKFDSYTLSKKAMNPSGRHTVVKTEANLFVGHVGFSIGTMEPLFVLDHRHVQALKEQTWILLAVGTARSLRILRVFTKSLHRSLHRVGVVWSEAKIMTGLKKDPCWRQFDRAKDLMEWLN